MERQTLKQGLRFFVLDLIQQVMNRFFYTGAK